MDGIGATRDAPPAATVFGIVDDAGFEATSGSTSIVAVTQDASLTWQAIGLPEPS